MSQINASPRYELGVQKLVLVEAEFDYKPGVLSGSRLV